MMEAARNAHEPPSATAEPPSAAAAGHWVGDAVPEQIAPLRAAVTAFAVRVGAANALVDDIRLAVSEALNNTVLHAYRNAGGRIEVRASADAGVMTIGVRDYGIGCMPRSDSPGIGMGLPLMVALARTVDIAAPVGGGTDVCLTFAVPAAYASPRRGARPALMAAPSAARGLHRPKRD